MGVLGAATGGPALLPEADCILMAGAANDYRVGFLQPGAISPDARIFFFESGWSRLDAAVDQAGGKPSTEWLTEARRRNLAFQRAVGLRATEQAKRGPHASHIIAALRQVLTDDTVLLADGGSIGQWVHQTLCDRYPGHWLTCGRSGVVGWGIGGAMAARVAFPNRPIILALRGRCIYLYGGRSGMCRPPIPAIRRHRCGRSGLGHHPERPHREIRRGDFELARTDRFRPAG